MVVRKKFFCVAGEEGPRERFILGGRRRASLLKLE